MDPYLEALRNLAQVEPAQEGEVVYLLIPESLPKDEDVVANAKRIGVNAIVQPVGGSSRLHRLAAEAGLDVSGPVVYRHRETAEVQARGRRDYDELAARLSELEALAARLGLGAQ